MRSLGSRSSNSSNGATIGAQAAKRPSQSFLQLRYPFAARPALCQQYMQQYWNSGDGRHGSTVSWRHNISMWLEDMDTFAGAFACMHPGHEGIRDTYRTSNAACVYTKVEQVQILS